MEIKLGQNSKKISCRSKNIFIRLKNHPKAFLACPPSEKPYSAGMSEIKKLHEKSFFYPASETTFFLQKWLLKPKKTMKMSLIYENQPRGHPLEHSKICLFCTILTWKNFEARKKNFDDQRWGGPGFFFFKLTKCDTITPVQRTGEINSPIEFWIRGGVPVCTAKDGGEKLTRSGTIG